LVVIHQQFVDQLAIAIQVARARSPAVAAVREVLQQHISSWIRGSKLVRAFPA
jgi:hypothetical protein